MQSVYLQPIMRKTQLWAKKQSQSKPNQSQFLSDSKGLKNEVPFLMSEVGYLSSVIFFLHPVLCILFEKSLSLLSASQRIAVDKLMRKPRSMRIKKLTTNRMVANLRFEELNSGFVVSEFGL